MRKTRRAAILLVASTVVAPLGLVACTSDGNGPHEPVEIAEGVTYYAEEHTTKLVHVMEVDLSKASVDVLYPGKIGQAARPQDMAQNAGAVGVINGDFFHNKRDDNGVDATNASVGPMISGGDHLTAAVPEEQRTGPKRPPDSTNKSVLGVTGSQVLTTELSLEARVTPGDMDIAALNQYAIPENEIGLFTSDWGISRERAVCGNAVDKRDGDCSDTVREVIVEDGEVTALGDRAGEEPLRPNEVALLARDEAVERLSLLREGDQVNVDYELSAPDAADFTAALGGVPLLDGNGAPRERLEDDEVEPRTAVGWQDDGGTLVMVVVDGAGDSGGATQLSLAMYAAELGLEGAMNLDGGGSSLMATKEDGAMEVRNDPSDGGGREVANALAVFAEPPGEADEAKPPEGDGSNLAGTWEYRSEHAGDIKSLHIEDTGSVSYGQEGSPVAFDGELEEAPDDDWDYQVVVGPTGDDADHFDLPDIELKIRVSGDPNELIVSAEGDEFVYERVD